MITLLRKIRKSMLASGANRKYIFYAFGEITLVVIGILIALQINNWNTEKIQSNEEREILEEIRNTLQIDLDKFKSWYANAQVIEQRIILLQELIESHEVVDTVEVLFGAVYGILTFKMNTASYEELKSRGFNLVSEDHIRRLIIKIYDTHYKAVEHTNFIENNVILEALRPYYLKNFTDIRFSKSAKPKHLELLLSDDYFHNLVDYRLTVLRFLTLSQYPQVIDDMDELILSIDRYLKD